MYCEESQCELAAVSVETDNNENGKVLILAGYRPPSGCHDLFFEHLNECLDRYVEQHSEVFVVGDFNIDLSRDSFIAYKFTSLMSSHGLFNIIFSYTREVSGSQTLIDHIFTNEIHSKSEVLKSTLSDHYAQAATLNTITEDKKTRARFKYTRSFNDQNVDTFKFLLKKEVWSEVYMAEGLENKYNEFNRQLNYYFEISFPEKRKKIYEYKKKKVEFSDELQSMKEQCFIFYEKTKHLNSDHFLRQYYIRLKYRYRKQIQQFKSNKILETIENSDNKTKAVWKVINDNRSKAKKEEKKIKIMNNEGRLVTEPKEVCDTLNAYFVGIGDEFDAPSHVPEQICSRQNNSSFFLMPISKHEVLSIISELQSKNSAGVDEISSKLLKSVSEFVAAPLCHLINSSFIEGKFPSALKSTMVRPIFKKGNEESCKNYRPISLVSTLSKVFEKAVLSRLCNFLETHKILFQNQHGFIKNRSTTSAIISLTDRIVKDLDNGKCVSGLFFDLTKAFDMVNHALLLKKMHDVGIRGVAQDWFASYLENREQFVVIHDIDRAGFLQRHSSSRASIRRGVPQGSVLGPTLFLLFINNLQNSVNSGKLCLFADDTSLTLSSPTNKSLEQISFLESNSILQWFQCNQLVLNTEKTQLLQFHISNRSSLADSCSLNLLLDDTTLYSSENVRFLGLVLDKNLNYHKHIEQVTNKVSVGIFILRTLKKTVDIQVLLSAYYGIVFPYLAYAVPVWGSESQRTLHLFRLQKRAVRVIFSLARDHSCREIFKNNNILTFPSIYILETLLFIKKNMSIFYSPTRHNYSLRNSSNIPIPKHSTTFFKKQFHYNSIKLYNSLPQSLIAEQDHRAFKKGVKKLLLQEAVYSVREFLAGSR